MLEPDTSASSGSGVAKSFGDMMSISNGRVSDREQSCPYLKQFPLLRVNEISSTDEGRPTRWEQLRHNEHAFPCISCNLSSTACEASVLFD